MSDENAQDRPVEAGLFIARQDDFEVALRGIGDVRLTEFEQLLRAGLQQLYKVRGYDRD